MQNRLRQSAQEVAADAAPWRRGVPWYLIAIEAAVALAIGVYFITDPDAAQSTIRQLIAIVLVVISFLDIWSGFSTYRDPLIRDPMTPFRLVRGGAGMTIGLLALFATRWGWLTEANIREVLGYGLIAYGAIGVLGILASWSNSRVRWATIGGNILGLALGFVLIYNAQQEVGATQSTRYLGYAALIGGVVLAMYAFMVYRQGGTESARAQDMLPASPDLAMPAGNEAEPQLDSSPAKTDGPPRPDQPLTTERQP
jgi:uncharacterized membrane protein HdeD (DUF308 family)